MNGPPSVGSRQRRSRGRGERPPSPPSVGGGPKSTRTRFGPSSASTTVGPAGGPVLNKHHLIRVLLVILVEVLSVYSANLEAWTAYGSHGLVVFAVTLLVATWLLVWLSNGPRLLQLADLWVLFRALSLICLNAFPPAVSLLPTLFRQVEDLAPSNAAAHHHHHHGSGSPLFNDSSFAVGTAFDAPDVESVSHRLARGVAETFMWILILLMSATPSLWAVVTLRCYERPHSMTYSRKPYGCAGAVTMLLTWHMSSVLVFVVSAPFFVPEDSLAWGRKPEPRTRGTESIVRVVATFLVQRLMDAGSLYNDLREWCYGSHRPQGRSTVLAKATATFLYNIVSSSVIFPLLALPLPWLALSSVTQVALGAAVSLHTTMPCCNRRGRARHHQRGSDYDDEDSSSDPEKGKGRGPGMPPDP